jgi:hypothetical protein
VSAAAPDLTICIPTIGRPSLARTLRSLLYQDSGLAWECVVVGDSHAGTWRAALDGVPALLAELDSAAQETYVPTGRLLYAEHDGGLHMVGHPQRNYGATVARGRWLWWLGDDDVALPGAFEAIRRQIAPSGDGTAVVPRGPLLYRWIAPWKQILWHTPGVVGDEPGHIDAECLVAPNVPELLGTWTHRYQGDWDCITETIRRWDGHVTFRPEIIAQAQPSEAEDWTRQRAAQGVLVEAS